MARLRCVALTALLFACLLRAQSDSSFQQIPGDLSEISVGFDGAVWGVNVGGQIYTWNAQTSSWVEIPGSLTQVAVGSATVVWGVNAEGQTYRWNGSQWFGSWDLIPLPGFAAAQSVAVGADGDAWAIDRGNHAYHYETVTQDGIPSAAWEPVGGVSVSSISADNDGAVWAIAAQGTVERIDPLGQLLIPVQRALTQVSVGGDGDAWGLNGNDIYHYNRLTQSWDSIPGVLTRISVGSGANVWGLDASGIANRWNPQSQTWTTLSASLAQISAAQNGAVWGLDAHGNIFEFDAPVQPTGAFHLIPGALAQVAVAADGNVWGINATGQIFTFNPLTQSWTWIQGALAQIAIDSFGDIWASIQAARFTGSTARPKAGSGFRAN